MQRRIACLLVSIFLIGFYALSGVARSARTDFPVKFPPIKTKKDFKVLMELKGDRKLTKTEKEKRDLLVQILLDKDATKIPLPEWQEKHNYRRDLVRFRREYAAKLLGLRIAHKSVIPVLVKVVRDKKDDKRVRISCVRALSQIADKSMVPHLIDLLGTDLSFYAFKQLNQLLGGAIQKQEEGSPSKGLSPLSVYRPVQSAAERKTVINVWKTWWRQNQARVVLDRSRAIPFR